LFKKSVILAQRECDGIAILSAKYGLLHPDTIIEPYNKTLLGMPKQEQLAWMLKVSDQLLDQYPNARFVYYAGVNYYRGLPKGEYPFGNKTLGQRLQWLNQQIEGKGFL
jgi:hypothetical protein